MSKIVRVSGMIIALMALNHAAHAATEGVYFGGGVGLGNLTNFKDAKQVGSQASFSGKLFAGYNINPFIGFEASYAKYGRTTYESHYFEGVTFDYNLNTVNLLAKGYVPFNNLECTPLDFYALIGIGLAYGSADFKYRQTNLDSYSNSAFAVSVGIGASYAVNKHLITSLEYTRTQGRTGDADHLGIPYSNLLTVNMAYII